MAEVIHTFPAWSVVVGLVAPAELKPAILAVAKIEHRTSELRRVKRGER